MSEIRDEARGRWRSLLPQLGVAAKHLVNRHGPCPLCGGRDRFRFDDREGRGTWFCNVCGSGDGVRLTMAALGLDFREAAERIRELLPTAKVDPVRPSRPKGGGAKLLWEAGRRIGQDDASAYLSARGYPGPYSDQLRYHPACSLHDQETGKRVGERPALLARVCGPDGTGVAVHRTYLDGARKADIDSPRRITAGTLPKGSAVRLTPVGPMLGIAEGIETALAASRMFRLPVWSALNAHGLSEFIWPDEVTTLVIFGDRDAGFAGQAAAYRLAQRAAAKGLNVHVELPERVGTDWDDVFRERHEKRGALSAA